MQLKLTRRISSTVGCLLLATLGGCNLSNCVYELRDVAAAGVVSENGTQIVSATVSVDEQRDSGPDKTFTWKIISQTLAGHIQSMVFVDKTAKSVVLYTFPSAPVPAQSIVASGYATQSGGANLNGFFDILAHDRGLILITTDLPGKSLIEMPLTLSSKHDWNRPNCS